MNENKSNSKNSTDKRENIEKFILISIGILATTSVSFGGLKYLKKVNHKKVKPKNIKPIIDSTVCVVKDIIPKEKIKYALDNSSAIRSTATNLGNKVFMTSQQINKKLVEKGFMIKANGEYKLTELGKLFGKPTEKMTKAGHWFTNIEWLDGVLDLILSPDDWAKVIRTRETFEKYK